MYIEIETCSFFSLNKLCQKSNPLFENYIKPIAISKAPRQIKFVSTVLTKLRTIKTITQQIISSKNWK